MERSNNTIYAEIALKNKLEWIKNIKNDKYVDVLLYVIDLNKRENNHTIWAQLRVCCLKLDFSISLCWFKTHQTSAAHVPWHLYTWWTQKHASWWGKGHVALPQITSKQPFHLYRLRLWLQCKEAKICQHHLQSIVWRAHREIKIGAGPPLMLSHLSAEEVWMIVLLQQHSKHPQFSPCWIASNRSQHA